MGELYGVYDILTCDEQPPLRPSGWSCPQIWPRSMPTVLPRKICSHWVHQSKEVYPLKINVMLIPKLCYPEPVTAIAAPVSIANRLVYG